MRVRLLHTLNNKLDYLVLYRIEGDHKAHTLGKCKITVRARGAALMTH